MSDPRRSSQKLEGLFYTSGIRPFEVASDRCTLRCSFFLLQDSDDCSILASIRQRLLDAHTLIESACTIISSTKHSSVGTAVGIAIGAIALLVFLGVAFCVCRRRGRAEAARVSAFMVRDGDGDGERPARARRQPGLPAVPSDESGGAADNLDLVAAAAAPVVHHSEKDPDLFWAVAASIPPAPRAPIAITSHLAPS
ncbi:hypothetical protein C8F01DRAFT_1184358 [Mycena amicta]|nr:hypothetical protein C8F01DRAFT_1184358 [Mycena amicta]